jgi:hypothetical protein
LPQRRHYNIADDVAVPLYIMPGQADLIRDAKTLVAEFRAQLGDTVPAVVVLDTLNRSLSGSESPRCQCGAGARECRDCRSTRRLAPVQPG